MKEKKGLQVLWYLQGGSAGLGEAGRNRAAAGQAGMKAALTGSGGSTAPASPLSNKCATLHPKYTSPM